MQQKLVQSSATLQAKIGDHEMFLLEKAQQEDWHLLMVEFRNYSDTHYDCSGEECGNTHAQLDLQYCLNAQLLQRL